MTRLAIAVVLAMLLGATTARADQAADTLTRFNLMGRWAVDCADPVKQGVAYMLAADGTALFGNPVGSFPVLAASTDGREVTVTISFPKPTAEVRINTFTMVDGNTIAPLTNRNERSEYTVRDGILLRTGQRMPELHRCGQQ